MTSTFDAETFLNTQVDGEMDTQFTPIPEGDYMATIDKISFRKIINKNNEEQVIMDLNWEILDDAVKTATELEKPTVRQSLFLDLTPEGGIDRGKNKNVQLGKVREAVGQNKAGKTWGPAQLQGAVATIKTSQRVDGENIYSDVKKVAKPS